MAHQAIEMLKEDHQKVRKLLSQLQDTTEQASKTRSDLLDKIEKELKIHTTLEEEIFYPALKEAGKQEESQMYFEAREEHRAVEDLVLPDLKKTDVDSVQFSGRAKVLKELVEHHASEEESEMFPAAEKVLDKTTLDDLGEKMKQRKKELS